MKRLILILALIPIITFGQAGKSVLTKAQKDSINTLIEEKLPFVNVKDFGAVGDGVTEDSTAFKNALKSLYDNGGGTLFIPAGTYKISSLLEIPNDENYTIQQVIAKSIKIQGAGSWSSGNAMGTKPIGGTILDLRYNDPAHPFKIIARGTGGLEITGITFTNKGTPDSCDFIRIIGATSFIHHNSFYGTQAGFNASNDAIVFGGTYEGEPPYIGNRSEDSSAYSGYGSMITENFFDYIRRFAVLYTWTNGISFTNNTVWNHCGTNIPGGGAWESYGALNDVDNPNVGGYVAGNLIEATAYYTIFKLYNTGGMVFVGNSIYDEGSSMSSIFDMSYYSKTNTIITSMHTDSRYPNNSALKEDATSLGGNAFFNNHQSQESYWTNPFVYSNLLRLRGSNASLTFDNATDPTQNFFFKPSFSTSPSFGISYYDTSGISPNDLFSFSYIAKAYTQLSMAGIGVLMSGSDLRLFAGSSSDNVYLGSDYKVRVSNGVLYNTLATGTAPFSITSTTAVPNLTVQRVSDISFIGQAATDFDMGNKVIKNINKLNIPSMPLDTAGLDISDVYVDENTNGLYFVLPTDIMYNGDFTIWEYALAGLRPAGWVHSHTLSDSTHAYFDNTDNQMRIVSDGGTGAISGTTEFGSASIGATYGYSFDIIAEPDTGLQLYICGELLMEALGPTYLGVGHHSGVVTASDTNYVTFYTNGTCDVTIDNIKIWDINGAKKMPPYNLITIVDSLGQRVLPDTGGVTDGYVPKLVSGVVVWSPDISTSGSGLFNPDGVTIDTTAGGLARVLPAKVTKWDSVSYKANTTDFAIVPALLDDSISVKMNRSEMTGYASASHTHIEFCDTIEIAGWGVMDTVTTGDYVGKKMANDYTITEVSAYTNSGTVTFNIEERGETTPNTAGTDVMTSDLVADTDQQETSTFSNAGIAKNSWLVLNITSISGDPTILSITVRGVKTD